MAKRDLLLTLHEMAEHLNNRLVMKDQVDSLWRLG